MATVDKLSNRFDESPAIRWGSLEFERIDCGRYALVGRYPPEAGAPSWWPGLIWTIEVEFLGDSKWRASFGDDEIPSDHYLPEPDSLVRALDWAFGETFLRNRFAYSLLTGSEKRDNEVPHDEDPIETELGTFIVREPDLLPIRGVGESHLKVIDLPEGWTWTLQQTPDLAFVCLFHENVQEMHFYAETVTAVVDKAIEWIRLGVQRGGKARRLQEFLTRGPEKGETWYDRIS